MKDIFITVFVKNGNNETVMYFWLETVIFYYGTLL